MIWHNHGIVISWNQKTMSLYHTNRTSWFPEPEKTFPLKTFWSYPLKSMIFRAGNFKAHDAMVFNELVILFQENHPGGLEGTKKSYHNIMIYHSIPTMLYYRKYVYSNAPAPYLTMAYRTILLHTTPYNSILFHTIISYHNIMIYHTIPYHTIP